MIPASAAPATHEVDDRHLLDGPATIAIAQEVINERVRQDAKWGQQNHPDGTGSEGDKRRANAARALCDFMARRGNLTWQHILNEEVNEAFAESDPSKLREELLQVAAVATAWAEAIDRRTANTEEASA